MRDNNKWGSPPGDLLDQECQKAHMLDAFPPEALYLVPNITGLFQFHPFRSTTSAEALGGIDRRRQGMLEGLHTPAPIVTHLSLSLHLPLQGHHLLEPGGVHQIPSPLTRWSSCPVINLCPHLCASLWPQERNSSRGEGVRTPQSLHNFLSRLSALIKQADLGIISRVYLTKAHLGN